MEAMTSHERVLNTLEGKPVDYIPCYDAIWGETTARWRADGSIGQTDDPCRLLKMDLRGSPTLNCMADLDFQWVRIAEDEDTYTRLDGNGAIMRRHKHHESCPEHVDYMVKDRTGWEERIKPHLLKVDRRRIPFEAYRTGKRSAAERAIFYSLWDVAPFEQMQTMCGHENLLVGMALDPDWVRDMVMTYARFTMMHWDVLIAEEGKPDAMWFGEDLGYKFKPFFSPAMYEEILEPGHKMLFDWAHGYGLKVIVHSCGFMEPMVPGLLRAGMDFLQALEVKAGMDMRRLRSQYGNKLGLVGNIDARVLISNDRRLIDAEMDAKIPEILRNGGRYILMSDHSIPPQVDFKTMEYFFERGREMSRR
jgi:uroporphyrinogen decarboxylase